MAREIDIPPNLETADVFLPLGPFKFTMRHVALFIGGMMMWIFVASYVLPPILGVQFLYGMILAFPVTFLPCLIFAFVSIRGRTLDVYLSELFTYHFEARTYIRIAEGQDSRNASGDLYFDPDAAAIADIVKGPRAQVGHNPYQDR